MCYPLQTDDVINPFFQFVMSHAAARSLARQCPSCKRTQITPQSKLNETVRCDRCGTPIPPKAERRR